MTQARRLPGRRSRVAKVLGVVLVSLVVALVLAECLIALALRSPGTLPAAGWITEGVRSAYLREDWNVIQAVPALVQWDAEVTYLLRSGPTTFANREFSTTVRANSEGLRDDERSLSQPEILVLGDSYALGWGVEAEESFPAQLEAQLGRPVLNVSMASFGTARQTILLDRIDTEAVRAVVVQYFQNDYRENRAFLDSGNELPVTPQKDFEALIARRNSYRPLDYLRAFFDRSPFDPELHEEAPSRVARACLEVLDETPALEGVPILLLQIDPWADRERNLEAEWRDLLASGDFPDLQNRLEVFSLANSLDHSDFFDLDPHLRPIGHEKIARQLATRLNPILEQPLAVAIPDAGDSVASTPDRQGSPERDD